MGGLHVSIMMGVYNGGKFLGEQIDSIIDQTHKDWCLMVAIDQAKDNSRTVIDDYAAKLGDNKLKVLQGSGAGHFKTFMQLLSQTPPETKYAAFSDQDDIWHRDKLETAVAKLEMIDADQPAIYCGRTRLVDAKGAYIGLSPLFSRSPNFCNALVQSIAGGNTMVLNRSAIDLVNRHKIEQKLPGHDWWIYLLVSGAGGTVIYDRESKIDYRQHGGNLIGSNKGFLNRFKRLRLLLSGRFRKWMDLNLDALAGARLSLSDTNQDIFQEFVSARQANFITRVFLYLAT